MALRAPLCMLLLVVALPASAQAPAPAAPPPLLSDALRPLPEASVLRERNDLEGARALLDAVVQEPGSAPALRDAARLGLGNLALLQDDPARAAAVLAPAATGGGPFAPYARYLLARALGDRGDAAGGLRLLQPVAAAPQRSALRRAAQRLSAQLALAAGKPLAAADFWAGIEKESERPAEKNEARFERAQCLLAAGQRAGAQALLLDLYRSDLATPFGHRAGLWLRREFPKAVLLPEPPEKALALARGFLSCGRALDAWDLLEALQGRPLSEALRQERALLRVGTLYALRWNADLDREAEAVRSAYGAKPAGWTAALKALWTCLRTDDAARAEILGSWLLQTLPADCASRAETLYALGSFAYVHGDFAGARARLAALRALPAQNGTKLSALYKEAWSARKSGDAIGALELFNQLLAQGGNSLEAPARYFRATWLAERGQTPLAEADWGLLGQGGGYWGAAARQALSVLGKPCPPPFLPPLPPPQPRTEDDGPAFVAGALEATGLSAFAAEAYEPFFRRHAREPRARLDFARLLARSGQYGRALAFVRSDFPDLDLADSLPREVTAIVYPTPYDALLRSAPAPPALVYAIARRESFFDAAALSPVGAVGLMQLMPDTAARLALPGEVLPTDEELLDPETNLRIGGAYLARLTAEFPLTAAAVASYNAGEDRVALWERSFAPADEREFVAMIPYEETRRYAERVLSDYRRYQTLLGEEAAP